MKLLRNPYLSVVTAFLFLFTSCSQFSSNENGNFEKESFEKKNAQTTTTIAIELSKNTDFIALFERIILFSNQNINIEEVEKLLEKEVFNENKKLELAKAFGYKNIEDAYNYDMLNFDAIANINDLYNLKQFSESELLLIFTNVFELIPIKSLNATSSKDLGQCDLILTACNQSAAGTYAATLVGCVGVGAGVGALSFWCAGCLGYGLYSVCAFGATYALLANLDLCDYAYQNCILK